MRPILVRATKEPITRRSMTEAMLGEFKLTDEERAELLHSGSPLARILWQSKRSYWW